MPAQSIIESIYAGVLALDGVTYCRAYQNITGSTDGRGIPAHEVALVVLGGDDDEIAETLFNRVPAGVNTYGTTTVSLTDVQGFSYDLNFSRPAEVPIHVEVDVTVVDSSVYPSDGDAQIIAAILAYVSSGASALGIPSGYDQNGVLPGETVYASSLYVPVASVPGTKITAIRVGTAPSPTDSEVAVAWNEQATFSDANILVTEA